MFEAAAGKPLAIGLDMALARDLTARVRVVTAVSDDGVRTYAVRCTTYLPDGSITLRQVPALATLAEQGHLVLTPGAVLDVTVVRDDLQADLVEHPGSEVIYDPWGPASPIAIELGNDGATVVEARQGVATLSAPMKELEAAVLSCRLFHDGDPVLAWCIGNLVAITDRNDNVRPGRESEAKKIDPAAALINALVRASVAQPDDGDLRPSRPSQRPRPRVNPRHAQRVPTHRQRGPPA